jgi:hypothetical protein
MRQTLISINTYADWAVKWTDGRFGWTEFLFPLKIMLFLFTFVRAVWVHTQTSIQFLHNNRLLYISYSCN